MRPTQEATSTTTVTTLKWMNYEQSAVVAGRNIGGMVYLGPDLRQGALSATWKPTIVPTLPVAPPDLILPVIVCHTGPATVKSAQIPGQRTSTG